MNNLLLKIGNDTLQEHTSTKYLGMILQNNLKWDKHINMLLKVIN